ncbi:complex I NDUFA9 subunit family protein [Roseateles albus]|uniref:Complex I NDUFA9 subunit family protein n=1 Tax=Roseateles albus TaxID=2987525 RepID=A0ABT5KMM0_9BURK|nr:complex I NDUFA9 subunit family protein [Roseateles albus]MDC8774165.1 complex I NDUFA9 subunit family protein [Roseateles albus]
MTMMNTSNPNILILGGSGFIGRSLCEQLTRAYGGRARITVPTRRLAHAQAVQGLPGLTVLQADVHKPGQLEGLLPGHDVVINLIAILQGSEAQFERAHVDLPRRLAEACAASGVRRLIHVSALGLRDDGRPAPSRYLCSKAAGEAVLKGAELELTLLRPSVVFGARDRFVNLFAKLQSVFPVLPLAGAAVKFQPVWVEDVAGAIVACVQDRNTIGRTFELAGPQVLSLAQIAGLAGQISGHARPIFALPAPLAWSQAVVMEMMPGVPLMSRDNLASMQIANVASGLLPGLETLGLKPQSMAAVLPDYLSAGQGCARLEAWRAARD